MTTGVFGLEGLEGTVGDTGALQPYFMVDGLSRPHPGETGASKQNPRGADALRALLWGVVFLDQEGKKEPLSLTRVALDSS